MLVWDGWEQSDISYTLDIMKRYARKILFYIEKDEYMFLMKEADIAVKGNTHKGYDCDKFSDINLTSKSSVSFLYLAQMIKYDAQVVRQALLCLLLTQIDKYIFYVTVSVIHFFYTRGTGLAPINAALFAVVEIVLFLDVFYYLNWNDSMRGETYQRRDKLSMELLIRTITAILQGIFITFVCFYSL